MNYRLPYYARCVVWLVRSRFEWSIAFCRYTWKAFAQLSEYVEALVAKLPDALRPSIHVILYAAMSASISDCNSFATSKLSDTFVVPSQIGLDL